MWRLNLCGHLLLSVDTVHHLCLCVSDSVYFINKGAGNKNTSIMYLLEQHKSCLPL